MYLDQISFTVLAQILCFYHWSDHIDGLIILGTNGVTALLKDFKESLPGGDHCFTFTLVWSQPHITFNIIHLALYGLHRKGKESVLFLLFSICSLPTSKTQKERRALILKTSLTHSALSLGVAC